MKLKPLEQWICDSCGEIIQCPEDGYVQFGKNEHNVYSDFIIVHHLKASPKKITAMDKQGCYKYHMDLDLKSFLGTNGMAHLFALVDPGEHKLGILKKPETSEFRKWVTFYKRLQLPYYEEARLYWEEAKADGFFDDANETWAYLPETLRILIEKYGR